MTEHSDDVKTDILDLRELTLQDVMRSWKPGVHLRLERIVGANEEIPDPLFGGPDRTPPQVEE